MELKITALSIERFRALRKCRIDGLGRVNLITGRNNTGKSSVLEALRILAADALPSVIYSILRYREEDLSEGEEPVPATDTESFSLMSNLFNGFPRVSENLEPIVIAADSDRRRLQVTMNVAWVSEERFPDGSRRLVTGQPELFDQGDVLRALVIQGSSGQQRIVSLGSLRRMPYRNRPFGSELDESPLACLFVSPYGGERTGTLGPLWDKVALSDREKDVVDALRIIDPRILAVSMVGGEGPRQMRTAIVRSENIPRPVPLRSFGDGLNRLFGIALSLVNARDGLLLIDEFENGMHYSVQTDVWRAIFRLATRLDIQVFATSHSWDAIEAFQKAAAENPEEGVLVRLSRTGDAIIPTIFRESELAIATRDRIEVR